LYSPSVASSLDFLQATFEKIGFQGLIRHQSLQLSDLKPTLMIVLFTSDNGAYAEWDP
jgi:hypothetical protein